MLILRYNYYNNKTKGNEDKMEASRAIFSQETRDKIKKGLSNREKGRIRFEKLKELDETGVLAEANTRPDVATLIGYTKEQWKQGYSWVTNMIARGYLSETIVGFSPSGRGEYEYHMTGLEPDYDYKRSGNYKPHKVDAVKPKEELEKIKIWTDEAKNIVKDNYAIIISKNGVDIKIELDSKDKVIEIIKDLVKEL